MEALDGLDTSFIEDEEVRMRRHLLATEELEDDVLEEMETYVVKINRRNERHRVMLEEELATMRRLGSPKETLTHDMSLRELDQHVAELMRSGGASIPRGASSAAAKRIQAPLMRELTALKRSGWAVDAWMELVNEDPVRVARELSEARPHVEHHEILRRRLSALPWERDIELGLEVELHIKQPHRLNHLSRSIPSFTTHLASRPVEDATYRLHLWQPERTHPTLVPVPEQEERPVLQPVSALDEAHEAMLEAMDHESATDVEEAEPAHNNTGRPIKSLEEERQHPDTKHLHDDGVSDEDFFADDKWSVERWRWWREREERAIAKQEATTSPPISPLPPESVEEVVDVAQPEEEGIEPEDGAPSASVASTESGVVEPMAQEVISSDIATQRALDALKELIALLGLIGLADDVAQQGMNAIPEVRRGLAQHVNIAPRDVRVGRLLRLTLGSSRKGTRATESGHEC